MHENALMKLAELYDAGLFSPAFYKRKLPGREMLLDYERFVTLPFTYKQELRDTSAFERTVCRPEDVYGIFSSSGTTGDRTFYIFSKKDKLVHEEFIKAFYTELEVMPWDLGGVMIPVDTGVIGHTMMWQFTTMGAGYINCPEPSPENIIRLISELPITIVASRPTVLSALAQREDWTRAAQESSVKKLLVGGGLLSPERRSLLEYVWGAQCYNMFGMSEVFGPIAGECKYKDGQHYPDQYLLIEIIDPETKLPVVPGRKGVAVYTTLWDKGFPLIRYWTGDIMRLDPTPCRCKSAMPRLWVYGRLADCTMRDGDYVFPEEQDFCPKECL